MKKIVSLGSAKLKVSIVALYSALATTEANLTSYTRL